MDVMNTPDHRQPLSWLFSAVLLGSIAILPGEAHSYDACDNKLELEDGEPPGSLFGLGYAIVAHALAEKFCGASATPMASRFLDYAERRGCGPDTPIHSELKASLERLERADLALLAADGDTNVKLSPDEVQEWARAAVDEFGGCKSLIEFHDTELEPP
jgi:hypothetical protein